MKILGPLATFILFLCVTVAVPAYAQDRDESRPGQPQEEKAKDKDKDKDKDKAAKPGDARHEQAQPGAHQDDRRSEPAAGRQEERKEQHDQRPEQRMEGGNQQHRAHGQGKHIPDDKFRSSFGRQHTFHVQRTQIINNPQPVIVYSGYSFQLVDPWPAEWAYDDDVYVDYVDGDYYMFDALHPGIRIAVFVVGG